MNLSRRGTPRLTAATSPGVDHRNPTGVECRQSAGVGHRCGPERLHDTRRGGIGHPGGVPGPDRAVPPGGECPPAGAEEIETTGTTAVSLPVVSTGPDGRPLLDGDEDVVAAGQAERVGVGAQGPEGLDPVVLLPDVAALESLDDGVAQPGPGRRLGDGELGPLAGQPERTRRCPARTPASGSRHPRRGCRRD